MTTERDLILISDFMKLPLSKEKKWMIRYFKTRTKRLFLKYFMTFGSIARFCQHSGEVCTKRYVKKMKRQYILLVEKHEKAKADFDLDCLEAVENGRCKLQ